MRQPFVFIRGLGFRVKLIREICAICGSRFLHQPFVSILGSLFLRVSLNLANPINL